MQDLCSFIASQLHQVSVMQHGRNKAGPVVQLWERFQHYCDDNLKLLSYCYTQKLFSNICTVLRALFRYSTFLFIKVQRYTSVYLYICVKFAKQVTTCFMSGYKLPLLITYWYLPAFSPPVPLSVCYISPIRIYYLRARCQTSTT